MEIINHSFRVDIQSSNGSHWVTIPNETYSWHEPFCQDDLAKVLDDLLRAVVSLREAPAGWMLKLEGLHQWSLREVQHPKNIQYI